MSKKTIILNSKAFAYYFLQHLYRNHLRTCFDDLDLKKFIAFFCRYANTTNKLLSDEKGNLLTNFEDYKNFADDIISGFTFDVQKNGLFAYRSFKSDVLHQLRDEYLQSDDNFKDLVSEYESAYVTNSYQNVKTLMEIENICSRNSENDMKEMEEFVKNKGFDA